MEGYIESLLLVLWPPGAEVALGLPPMRTVSPSAMQQMNCQYNGLYWHTDGTGQALPLGEVGWQMTGRSSDWK